MNQATQSGCLITELGADSQGTGGECKTNQIHGGANQLAGMHTLFAAARVFSKTDVPLKDEDSDLRVDDLYRERLGEAKSDNHSATIRKYLRLCTVFEGVNRNRADKGVIQVAEDVIRFCPLQVTSPLPTQAYVFDVLSHFWKKNERVAKLIIDVEEVSPSKIRHIMTGVSVETVINGMDLWAILPCRIDAIDILEPDNHSMVWWMAKKVMRATVPPKVWEKISFTSHRETKMNTQVLKSELQL